MDNRIKSELIGIVGTDRAADAPEERVAYSYDAYVEEHLPDLVLFPETTEEVSAIMRIANREGIPVTPRGSATNLAGETVPIRGGIVLSLTRMDKILDLDPGSLTATVQPGVINMDLQREAAKHNLMYPPDPASWGAATMGGNVATNAGGPRTLKYGVTKDYLLGLKAVMADGDVLSTGGRTIKNVTGYNLTQLLCGSEGTLGVITEITVRLVPKPPASQTMRADFPRLEDCSNAVSAIMAAGIVPAALELMNQFVVQAADKAFNLGLPVDMEGILIIQLDGHPNILEDEAKQIEAILRENNVANILTAKDADEAEKLWMARRAGAPALMRLRPNTATEDVTVPVARLSDMIRKVNEICERYDIKVGVLAHAGDGNLHPCMVFDQRDKEEFGRVKKIFAELVPAALELGGTLSGEHGIGLAKAPFLNQELDDTALRTLKGIKNLFDPNGILNPGKFV